MFRPEEKTTETELTKYIGILKKIMLAVLVFAALVAIHNQAEKQAEQELRADSSLSEELKTLVTDVFMDKIIIREPDNNFNTSDLEKFLKSKGYSDEEVKKAVFFGGNIHYVAFHIFTFGKDKSFDEMQKNLLDEEWLKENRICSYAFSEEEIETGKKLYEHNKQQGLYDF